MERSEEAVALGKVAVAAGYRLLARGEVTSTNDVALARASEAPCSRLWVVAQHQTRGRGRHGRAFASAPGNLHASLVLIDPCAVVRAPELGFVAGLALFEAAHALTGLEHPRLSLKWPNDLLIDRAKCAGILLEGHRLRNGTFALVIGIGVNVAAAPPVTPRAAMLATFAPDATASRLLSLLSDAFARQFAEFAAAPQSSEAHFAAWAGHAHGIGSRVRIRLPRGEVVGLFRGLDRGRLILDTADGQKTLDAGDLYVMNEADRAQPALL